MRVYLKDLGMVSVGYRELENQGTYPESQYPLIKEYIP